MDDSDWGSSVWDTPSAPSKSSKPSEPNNDATAPSHTQTLSFSVDDAFDDKSAPTTPGFFSTKFSGANADSLNDFDGGVNGTRPTADDGFGDFGDDDFEAPSASGQTLDDDFGDFGDFGDGADGGGFDTGASNEFGGTAQDQFGSSGFGTGVFEAPAHWRPLQVDPLSEPRELAEELKELLGPIWAHLRPDELLSDEPERQVEGVAQVLVTPESRSLYTLLTQLPPNLSNPPTWTRSRVRRQHLIALGIPVNLDEVLPQSSLKPLPVLHIQTQATHHPRPVSAPPGPRAGDVAGVKAGTGSARGSRAGTPVGSPVVGPGRKLPATASGASRLGPKPQIDRSKIEEALAITPDSLSLMPLAHLESHLATMRLLTSSTSTLLTHLLQQREALQQDSETYNGLIAGLVGEAQKMKSGGARSRTGAVKRGSLM